MVAQDLGMAIEGNAGLQVVDVVHRYVCGEPVQGTRQEIMQAAMERSVVKLPVGVVIPTRLFELVLEVEQPDPDRGGHQYLGQQDEGQNV